MMEFKKAYFTIFWNSKMNLIWKHGFYVVFCFYVAFTIIFTCFTSCITDFLLIEVAFEKVLDEFPHLLSSWVEVSPCK